MSDMNREFELSIWKDSLIFGLMKGDSFISSSAVDSLVTHKIFNCKGEISNAILGRTTRRTSTT